MDSFSRPAREILDLLEATFQPTHRYVTARAEDYRHLDLAWYDRASGELASRGFTRLADLEDKTVTEAPGTVLGAIMIRTFASRDGTIVAALYHPQIKSFLVRALLWILRKLPGKVTDMETEFSDGSFVATSNATSAAAIETGPMIDSEFLPESTSPAQVHARHTARVAAHLVKRAGVEAREIRTREQMIASQNRMNALKAAYRGEVGGITREELDRLAGLARPMVGEVHSAIQRERVRRAG